MSYFVKGNFPAEKVRCKARPRELNAERVRNRSELVGAEAAVIANNAEGSFLHKKLTVNEVNNSPRVHTDSNKRAHASNNIFGPPIQSPRPNRRVPIPDEVVKAVYPPRDSRKDDAQAAMARGSTLVDKMYTDTDYPTITKDHAARPLVKHQTLEVYSNEGVDGFRGMGGHCRPSQKSGLSTKPVPTEYYLQDLPDRQKKLSPRVRQRDVFNPINGQQSPYYGQNAQI